MADLHPVTNALPGTTARGDTSGLGADATELHALAVAIPVAAEADLGTTADLTTAGGHTATGAIAATYDDLAAARTSVNTLRTDVEAALDDIDADVATAVTEVEARLDDIEAKVDALLAKLRTAAVIAA